MARRTPKKAGKSKAKALKRTAKGRGAKPAAVRAKRKAARVSSKPTSRKATGPRKRPARRPKLQVGRDRSPSAKAIKAVKKKSAKAIKAPPPRKAAPARKVAAPTAAVLAAQDRRIRNPPARLDRVRRTLDDIVPTPPSSLDLNRDASAARSGRAEIAESKNDHQTMSPSITGGDVDISVEGAYFSGDEAPGGDNPTPDQDIVDDIGRALGVQYQDNEELQSGDKVAERDKHRWELDPASAEDYRDRK